MRFDGDTIDDSVTTLIDGLAQTEYNAYIKKTDKSKQVLLAFTDACLAGYLISKNKVEINGDKKIQIYKKIAEQNDLKDFPNIEFFLGSCMMSGSSAAKN
jgi:translation initiation factor 1 (eIF-1/SUI1)